MFLTNAKGELTNRGKLFEAIVNERATVPRDRSLYTTDPFRRGRRVEGPYIVAESLSGRPLRVAQILKKQASQSPATGRSLLQRQQIRIRGPPACVAKFLEAPQRR